MNRIGAVLLLAVACGPIAPPCGPGPHADVDVTVSSVTLGDQCGARAAPADSLWAGDCAPTESGGCGGLCRQSSVQLDIVSRDESAADFRVVAVRLYDSAGQLAHTLTTSAPTKWSGSGYTQWDEVIAPLSNLKAKYDLSSPDYSSTDSSRLAPYAPYKTQVDVEVNGRLRTLNGPDAYREPDVAT
jgi:hypothetical protein